MGYKYSKEDIIQKGSWVIQTQGYNNTGISDILKSTGIPKGSFYNFFDNKESFLEEAIDYYAEQGYHQMKKILGNTDLSPLERLKSFYYDFMISSNKQTECRAGCLINNLSYELGAINLEIAKRLDKHFKRQVKLLANCISKGQESGQFRTDYKASELAEFMHTNTIGGMGRMKTLLKINPLKRSIDMSLDFIKK